MRGDLVAIEPAVAVVPISGVTISAAPRPAASSTSARSAETLRSLSPKLGSTWTAAAVKGAVGICGFPLGVTVTGGGPKVGGSPEGPPDPQRGSPTIVFSTEAPTVYFGSTMLPSLTRPHWVSSM